jgi:hypothetical protein
MKLHELFEGGSISDFLAQARDPLRRHPGNEPSNADKLAFYKKKLAELSPTAPKSHRAEIERQIKRLSK